jgi:hypothetical protein
MNLDQIQSDCRDYAGNRGALSTVVGLLNEEIEAVKRRRLPYIRRLVARAAELHADLKAHIEAAPELFKKPRTLVFHGIKVGYAKGKGGIEIPDEAATIERLTELMPTTWRQYVHEIYKPDKSMLSSLPVASLKKLGCTVVGTGDQVVIKPTDTAVDKLVTALLKAATEETLTADER